MNNRFDNDFLWLTHIEPLKNKECVDANLVMTVGSSSTDQSGGTGSLFPATGVPPAPAGASTAVQASNDGAPQKVELRILGLYRKTTKAKRWFIVMQKPWQSRSFLMLPTLKAN